MSSSLGKKIAVPASKKRKGASSSAGPTAKIHHPLLQFPRRPQEELFHTSGSNFNCGSLHRLIAVEQVQLADLIRAFLTTNPWEQFFGIIKLTYLELTMELCSTFHLQIVMTYYDDPDTVQFCLGGLIRQLSVLEFGAALGLYTRSSRRRMNYMLSVATYISLPRSAGTLWPLTQPSTILAAPRH
ncbi:hypothetical protein GOBAR_AA05297 [Gossypium barbadense]|uniref:Uncharacterized protein n=1 Tax=Gossypium barbadense TaxID=3634 RepID=A0A2P5YI77_GOSBA|nr:hypothetical protein GOBAR_AA05297 [Gossypium barbadense]